MEEAKLFKTLVLSYQNIFNFNGHQSRRSFLYYLVGLVIQELFLSGLVIITLHMRELMGNNVYSLIMTAVMGMIVAAWLIALVLTTFSSYVRRLHDMGFSGVLYLIMLFVSFAITAFGRGAPVYVIISASLSLLFTLVLVVAQSKEEDNPYRTANPFLVRPDYVTEVFTMDDKE
ncbi:hypothetical protein CKF54_01795 [Psittacicella hinzii]|uniref:DUF805 domain-containing protein n=1 Tax=Psittacicella hinzii TaxID=2028575 RepID=A0A3A1Y8M4_9GAMM|nr:DUF805 domain-containing protein [Psittacicella hinzii]RIY34015.1 hypothetical protein CKF54_01795 [Psittacicella hinzii]